MTALAEGDQISRSIIGGVVVYVVNREYNFATGKRMQGSIFSMTQFAPVACCIPHLCTDLRPVSRVFAFVFYGHLSSHELTVAAGVSGRRGKVTGLSHLLILEHADVLLWNTPPLVIWMWAIVITAYFTADYPFQ